MDHQLIAPALALLGTALVAAVGFYQWRKQNANPNRASNAAAKREAYEGLWKKLEEANLELRKTDGTVPSVGDHLKIINEYFIGHSLYFDDADQGALNKYITSMHNLQSSIQALGDSGLKKEYELTMSGHGPDWTPVMHAVQEMEKYRAIIKEKVTRVCASS